MRFIKYFAILPLCLFLGNCDTSDSSPKINIGDYDNQLAAWNSQNMLDYKLRVVFYGRGHPDNPKRALVIVKNGIPESSNPPEWLTNGEMSTMPDFFSFIKEEENSIMNTNALVSLYAKYDTVYHYPTDISKDDSVSYTVGPVWGWIIELILMVENQQEAWNRLNILDYKLHVQNYDPGYGSSTKKTAVITVKNGRPESSDPPEWLMSGEKSTIPEFFSFLKEEETRLEDFILSSKDYVKVWYNLVYHYPLTISTADNTWNIKLILPEETE